MHEEMLTYGLKENTTNVLLHIDNELVLKGKQCGCICPNCRRPLIARRGKKNEHHFAHSPEYKSCGKGRMTALHILAQNVLKREKKVMLPEYRGNYYKKKAACVMFEDVDLEKDYRREDLIVRPDCVGYVKGKNDLFIEILVTHEVDDIKQAKIKQLGYPCIEIDLSNLLSINYTEQEVYSRLFDEIEYRAWINSPESDEIEERLRKEDEKRKEERMQEEEKKAAEKDAYIKHLKQKVDEWYINKRQDDADYITQQIETSPYNESRRFYNVFAPEDNLTEYIENAPRNSGALQVFYTLLKTYMEEIPYSFGYKRIKYYLNDFYSFSTVTQEEKIFLEELVSLKILYILLSPNSYHTQRDRNVYESCAKRYITDAKIRKQVLMIASVYQHHIIGSRASSFEELTDEIIRDYPSLAELYLNAMSRQPANEYLLKNCRKIEPIISDGLKPNSIVKTIITDCLTPITPAISEKPTESQNDSYGRDQKSTWTSEDEMWRRLNIEFQKQTSKKL